jgi:hypothetical protein
MAEKFTSTWCPGGTSFADVRLRADVYMGSPFSQSRLEWNGNGRDLKTVGGGPVSFHRAARPITGAERAAAYRH